MMNKFERARKVREVWAQARKTANVVKLESKPKEQEKVEMRKVA